MTLLGLSLSACSRPKGYAVRIKPSETTQDKAAFRNVTPDYRLLSAPYKERFTKSSRAVAEPSTQSADQKFNCLRTPFREESIHAHRESYTADFSYGGVDRKYVTTRTPSGDDGYLEKFVAENGYTFTIKHTLSRDQQSNLVDEQGEVSGNNTPSPDPSYSCGSPLTYSAASPETKIEDSGVFHFEDGQSVPAIRQTTSYIADFFCKTHKAPYKEVVLPNVRVMRVEITALKANGLENCSDTPPLLVHEEQKNEKGETISLYHLEILGFQSN